MMQKSVSTSKSLNWKGMTGGHWHIILGMTRRCGWQYLPTQLNTVEPCTNIVLIFELHKQHICATFLHGIVGLTIALYGEP